MNKDDAVKLAEDVGYTENEMSSDGEWNICMTEDALLAFSNACKKIGMEKAAEICDEQHAIMPHEGGMAGWCACAIRKAIE